MYFRLNFRGRQKIDLLTLNVKSLPSVIQIIALYVEKSWPTGRRVTLPAESTLSSVRMKKKLPRLTELMAGRLSSEFTQTLIFLQ